jgi:hypothetical protein
LDGIFLKQIGNERWSYFPGGEEKGSTTKKLIKLIQPKGFFHAILLKLENFLHSRLWAISYEWKDLLIVNRIDKVVLNEARQYPFLLITCNYLNIKTLLIFHTNKEIYAQGRILNYFSGFGLWNETQRLNLQKVFNIQKGIPLRVVGSSHFTYLNYEKIKGDVLKAHSIREELDSKPFILYCASESRLFPNQLGLVIDLFDAIKKVTSQDFLIVIRKNPMDRSDYWESLDKAKFYVDEPAWFFDTSVHFNYTMLEDLSIYSWLLRNCNFCVSIPSTISLECALMKKNIVNLCYDPLFEDNDFYLKFWNAPFYKSARESQYIMPVFDKSELERILSEALVKDNAESREEYIQMELGVPIDKVIEAHINFILFET